MNLGDIVTVRCPKSTFDGAQGEVVKVLPESEEEDVMVKLGPAKSYLVGHCLTEEEGWIAFYEKDLRKDEDWDWENRVILTFGKNNWHTVFTKKEKFVPDQPCDHRDCDQLTTRRILVNVWGSVIEHDVCEQHAKHYNGKCVDEFPGK